MIQSRAWALLLLTGWASGPAHAAVLTRTVPVSSTVPFRDLGVDVLVPRFDPALGRLTGVAASLSGQLTPGLENLGGLVPRLESPVVFQPAVSFNYPVEATQVLAFQSVAITDGGRQAIGAPQAVTLDAALAPMLPNANPAVGFTGLGTVLFVITGESGPLVGRNLSLFGVVDVAAFEGQLAVSYTFDPVVPVPEPASWALLGAALAGLRLTMRRPAAPASTSRGARGGATGRNAATPCNGSA